MLMDGVDCCRWTALKSTLVVCAVAMLDLHTGSGCINVQTTDTPFQDIGSNRSIQWFSDKDRGFCPASVQFPTPSIVWLHLRCVQCLEKNLQSLWIDCHFVCQSEQQCSKTLKSLPLQLDHVSDFKSTVFKIHSQAVNRPCCNKGDHVATGFNTLKHSAANSAPGTATSILCP